MISNSKVHSVCSVYRPWESFWVDSNGTNEKSTFRRFAKPSWLSTICNHFVDIAAWSLKLLTMLTQKLIFLGKKTPYGQILKHVFRKDSPSLRSTSCVQISWNLA